MPRIIDPSSLSRGGGLASRRSVEPASFVQPTFLLEGLEAHIIDPSRAHMAETIGVVDAGGFFASDEVEDALQEIAVSHSNTNQNGVYSGGTYTSVGLTVTLDTPTLVMVNGTERDLGGDSTLLVDASVNWLYVNGSTGALTSSVGAIPTITSPENVLLARIVTAAGVVSSSRDARWFVRNVERKLPFTVRASGTAADRNSEAAFESIDAAILYLENLGASVIRNFTLVLKGSITVSTSIVIPVAGVTLQGEAGCILTTGAVLAPMLDISAGQGITIRDITFKAAHAACTAIGVTSSGVLSGITIERCTFTNSGGTDWAQAIDFNMAGPQTQVSITGGTIAATTYGIRMREPVNCRVKDLQISEVGAAGTIGLDLGLVGGAIGSTADCIASGVTVTGFATGGFFRGSVMRVQSCSFNDSATGVQVGPGSSDFIMTNCPIQLDSTVGLTGVDVDGDDITIKNCQIVNQKAPGAYAAEVPLGITIASGVDTVTIANCKIDNFLNTVTPGGFGIRFVGTSINSVIEGNTILTTETGITVLGATSRLRINGCSIQDVKTGIIVPGDTILSDTSISLDSTRALIGISLSGSNIRVTGCRINNSRASGSYGALDVPLGIKLAGTSRVTISGTEIIGFYNSTGNLGSLVGTTAPSTSTVIDGCLLETGNTGVDATSIGAIVISGTQVRDVETGITLGSATNTVTGCLVDVSSTRGVTGIKVSGANTTLSGCTINSDRVAFAGETPVGVNISAQRVKVAGCTLTGWRNAGGSLGAGILCDTGASQVTVGDCSLDSCWYGVLSASAAAADTITVTDNLIMRTDAGGISITNSEQVHVSGNTINDIATGSGVFVSSSTDIEVSGNKVHGVSTGLYGIQLTGADVAANRLRRFVISGNTIRAVTTAGILLSGYVQNGTVSNNHIDCNLSAGDPSALSCILISTSGTSLAKYVDIVGNTCWRAKSGIVASGVDYLAPITSINISGNNIHHCAISSGASTECYGVSLVWATDCDVLNNTVYQIGQLISDGDVVSTPVAGANVVPIGIHLQNTVNVTASSNSVTDLVAVGTGASIGIHMDASSNTAPNPVDTRANQIINNRIMTADAGVPHTFGILVIGGQSGLPGDTVSVYGLNISGNTIRNTDLQAIRVAVNGGCVMEQVSINNNVINTSASSNGHGVNVALALSAVFANAIVLGVEIVGNNIGEVTGSGVFVTTDTGCSLTGVTINENTILNAATNGISVIIDSAPSVFTDMSISHNSILGPTDEGILVTVTDYSVSNMAINGNTITATNGGASADKGVSVSTLTSGAVLRNDLVGLTLSNNRIISSLQGIELVVTGLLQEASLIGNVVNVTTAVSNTSITMDTALTVLAQAFSRNITLSGNSFVGGQEVLVTVGHGQKLSCFNFTNNTLQGGVQHGFVLTVADATVGAADAVSDITVSGNSFRDVVDMAVRLILGSSQIDPCSNVAVINNRFIVCNTGGTTNNTVFISCQCLNRNLQISGNTFKECGTLDSTSGVVEIQLGTTGAGNTGENIVVTGNSYAACFGPSVYVKQNAAAANWTLVNLRVDGNTIQENTYSAIVLDLTSFTSVKAVSVSDNMVNNVSGAGSDVGIKVMSPNGDALNQLSVCRNSVKGAGNGEVGAVYIDVNDDINDLSINENVIEGSLATSAAIYVGVDGLWLHGSVSNNLITSPVGAGIELNGLAADAGTTGIRGLSVSNNQIRASTGRGVYIHAADATSTPVLNNIVVSNNMIENVGSDGIAVRALTGTALDCVTIDSNSLRNIGADGILVELTGATEGYNVTIVGNTLRDITTNGIEYSQSSTGQLLGMNISNNSVYDIDVHGIKVEAALANVGNAVISGNHVRNWSQSALATPYGGIHLSTTDAKNVNISNNVVRTNETQAIGYWLLILGVVRTLNLSNNTADLANGANTESLRFDTGVSADQLSLSITGNSFLGAATAANFNVSSFSPDRSVCSNNNERTTDGTTAGDWVSFVIPFTNSKTTNNQD